MLVRAIGAPIHRASQSHDICCAQRTARVVGCTWLSKGCCYPLRHVFKHVNFIVAFDSNPSGRSVSELAAATTATVGCGVAPQPARQELSVKAPHSPTWSL